MHIIELAAKVTQESGVHRGNAGDTALGSAFEYLFEKEFPDSKITFMQCRKIFTKEDIDLINKSDLLLVAGGGLFLYDSIDPRTNQIFKNDVSDWMWGISVDLLDKIKIPIVVYAVGYNKFRGQREFRKCFDETVSKLIEKSVFFSMRNSGSVNALKKHVDKSLHDKIKLNFCPTLVLNEKYCFKPQSYGKRVGFVFGGDRLPLRHENLEQFVLHIQRFVEYLKEKKYETILINHLHDYWIQKYIQFDKTIELFGKPSKDIYKTYSKIDFVVGDRGHSQMIPFACGCKIISIISHDKLKWFLDDIDLKEFGIEENDIDLSNKLIQKFEKLNTLDWKPIQTQGMEIIYKVNKNNLTKIKNLLHEKFKVPIS